LTDSLRQFYSHDTQQIFGGTAPFQNAHLIGMENKTGEEEEDDEVEEDEIEGADDGNE
jgi:hypothetical protein